MTTEIVLELVFLALGRDCSETDGCNCDSASTGLDTLLDLVRSHVAVQCDHVTSFAETVDSQHDLQSEGTVGRALYVADSEVAILQAKHPWLHQELPGL